MSVDRVEAREHHGSPGLRSRSSPGADSGSDSGSSARSSLAAHVSSVQHVEDKKGASSATTPIPATDREGGAAEAGSPHPPGHDRTAELQSTQLIDRRDGFLYRRINHNGEWARVSLSFARRVSCSRRLYQKHPRPHTRVVVGRFGRYENAVLPLSTGPRLEAGTTDGVF